MKIYVIPFYLKELVFREINPTIELHRESKRNYFYFEHYDFAADQEVEDFIFSIPFFSEDLKEFLRGRDNLISTEVTKAWINKYIENIEKWAESEEWLFYDVGYICDPLLNKSPERIELDLTPNSKAIYYCKKKF